MHARWMKYAWQIGFGEQSKQVLWTLHTKLIEIPFIRTVALQRNRARDRQTDVETDGGQWFLITEAGKGLHHMLEYHNEEENTQQVSF